jgi:hypothetical protein
MGSALTSFSSIRSTVFVSGIFAFSLLVAGFDSRNIKWHLLHLLPCTYLTVSVMCRAKRRSFRSSLLSTASAPTTLASVRCYNAKRSVYERSNNGIVTTIVNVMDTFRYGRAVSPLCGARILRSNIYEDGEVVAYTLELVPGIEYRFVRGAADIVRLVRCWVADPSISITATLINKLDDAWMKRESVGEIVLNLPVCVAACWRVSPLFVVSTTAEKVTLQVEVSRMYRTSEIGPRYADVLDDLITDPADCASIHAFISCAHYPESSAAVFFRNDGDGRLVRKIAQFCGNGGSWEMRNVVVPPPRQAVLMYRDGRWVMRDGGGRPPRQVVPMYRDGRWEMTVPVYRDGRWEMEDTVAPSPRRTVLRYRLGQMRLVHLPLDTVVRATRMPGLSIHEPNLSIYEPGFSIHERDRET